MGLSRGKSKPYARYLICQFDRVCRAELLLFQSVSLRYRNYRPANPCRVQAIDFNLRAISVMGEAAAQFADNRASTTAQLARVQSHLREINCSGFSINFHANKKLPKKLLKCQEKHGCIYPMFPLTSFSAATIVMRAFSQMRIFNFIKKCWLKACLVMVCSCMHID